MQTSILERELKAYERRGAVGPMLEPIYDFLLKQSLDDDGLRRDVIKTVEGMIQRNGIQQRVVA